MASKQFLSKLKQVCSRGVDTVSSLRRQAHLMKNAIMGRLKSVGLSPSSRARSDPKSHMGNHLPPVVPAGGVSLHSTSEGCPVCPTLCPAPAMHITSPPGASSRKTRSNNLRLCVRSREGKGNHFYSWLFPPVCPETDDTGGAPHRVHETVRARRGGYIPSQTELCQN